MFTKKDEKQSFSVTDLDYLNQYIVLKYNDIRFFKNVFFLIVKKREEIFDFIMMLDKDHVKRTAFLYVTEDIQHNSSIFNEETNDILNLEINKQLLDFLKIRIDNGRLFERIDNEYNGLFKSKGVVFFIFVLVLYFIIYMIGSRFVEIAESGDIGVDLSSVMFFYNNNFYITLLFFFVISSLFIFKFIKHIPFYEFTFSKYYVLLKYKEKFYSTLLSYYVEKGKKKGEIGYINTKNEFFNIFSSFFQYLGKDEIGELLFFLENSEVQINIRNPLLKQDIINDYKNFNKIQNENVRMKVDFYEGVKEKNRTYYDLLRLNFESEIMKLKEYMNFKGLFLYLFVTLAVIMMITPVLLSALS